ncbi:hypothetical protein HS088_TW13G01594 [Tripterygium wilfordii]|uniref:DIRP domain-containing protein n=1 Tax=Tripterygium wilfordii TaxID=458696 RepID=A0A7J7CX85_TRIWF|nr:hypothetical protein HS088_TW13G01594 [Tripterygium wilfordii]
MNKSKHSHAATHSRQGRLGKSLELISPGANHEDAFQLLSRYKVRRWCVFEWFYSAIDYPWFAKREFVEYLDHVGLGHVPRLTRVEWGVIRRCRVQFDQPELGVEYVMDINCMPSNPLENMPAGLIKLNCTETLNELKLTGNRSKGRWMGT